MIKNNISELCTIKARIGWQGLRSEEFLSHGIYSLVTGTDIKDGTIDWSSTYYVSPERYNQDTSIQLKLRDILISKDGTIGKVGYVDSLPHKATLNSGVYVVRSKNEEILRNDFLSWFFKSAFFEDFIKELKAGSTISHLYQKDFVKLIIKYPQTTHEQRLIAEALNDMNDLIRELDTLIEKKKSVLQGTMQELLTACRRLSGFSSPWKTQSITDICSIKARIGWQGLRSDEFLNSGDYVLVTGTDILQGHVNWSHTYFVSIERFNQDKSIQLKLGDILITKDGTIGKVAFIDKLPKPATLNSGVYVIRPKQGQSIFNGYLSWFFKSSFFDDFIQELRAGSTISHLHQKDFVKLNIFAPSDTAEQQAITAILSDMDSEIAELESKREKYAAIRQGMMQQLITGKIRLI